MHGVNAKECGVVKQLLDADADVSLRSRAGRTALGVARQVSDNQGVIDLLVSHGVQE